MPKTYIETKDGTKITIEGDPEEIAKVLKLYGSGAGEKSQLPLKKFTKGSKPGATVTDRVRELIAAGFFDKPRGLAELKAGLEEQGHFVPVTTLSGMVLKLTRYRELRRLKNGKTWTYVKT